jgi:hypothetical protein
VPIRPSGLPEEELDALLGADERPPSDSDLAVMEYYARRAWVDTEADPQGNRQRSFALDVVRLVQALRHLRASGAR